MITYHDKYVPSLADAITPCPENMKDTNRLRCFIIPAILIIAAAILRIYGIGWGLPQVYEEATPLFKAWEMWGWGAHDSVDLNPHFFNYPSLSITYNWPDRGFFTWA